MHESIACPQCGAPAQITERFWLGGTAGPVEHVKTGCINNHWLTPLAEMIQGATPAMATPAARAEVAGPLRGSNLALAAGEHDGRVAGPRRSHYRQRQMLRRR